MLPAPVAVGGETNLQIVFCRLVARLVHRSVVQFHGHEVLVHIDITGERLTAGTMVRKRPLTVRAGDGFDVVGRTMHEQHLTRNRPCRETRAASELPTPVLKPSGHCFVSQLPTDH